MAWQAECAEGAPPHSIRLQPAGCACVRACALHARCMRARASHRRSTARRADLRRPCTRTPTPAPAPAKAPSPSAARAYHYPVSAGRPPASEAPAAAAPEKARGNPRRRGREGGFEILTHIAEASSDNLSLTSQRKARRMTSRANLRQEALRGNRMFLRADLCLGNT